MLTGLNGDSARVMRDMFASEGAGADDVQPAPDGLPLSNPLRKSVRDRGQTPPLSVERPRGWVAKIIEAELSVVVPEDGAKPTQYCVVLNGDIDRPGSGVLEFYSKSSGVFKKKYNLSKLPAHKLRIDESCIEVSQTGPGTVQIVHAKKGPYSLQSSSDLSAWATALESLQLNEKSDA